MSSCESCGRLMPEHALDDDGFCPNCSDPDLSQFEQAVAAYSRTYHPEEYHRDDDDDYGGGYGGQSCPRCGAVVDRLVGVSGRSGPTRYVCEDCQRDARASDRSFWHWYWKE